MTAAPAPAREPATPERPPAGEKSGSSERTRAERRLGWLLCAPALAVMVGVTAYPLGRAVWLSLYSYRITDPAGREFVGLRNYGVVLSDSLWWSDVATTVLVTVVTVAVELVIGFVFASVMHRIVFGRRLIRTSILVPYGIITVVAAFAWRYAFALDTGFVNGLFGLGDFAWFGQRWSALFVISLAEIWKTTPFMSLLLLAGLAQVPRELLEAAEVDGATRWQRLVRVTLPSMKAAIMVALLFRTLDAYRIFDTVFVTTRVRRAPRRCRSWPTARRSRAPLWVWGRRCRCSCSPRSC